MIDTSQIVVFSLEVFIKMTLRCLNSFDLINQFSVKMDLIKIPHKRIILNLLFFLHKTSITDQLIRLYSRDNFLQP